MGQGRGKIDHNFYFPVVQKLLYCISKRDPVLFSMLFCGLSVFVGAGADLQTLIKSLNIPDIGMTDHPAANDPCLYLFSQTHPLSFHLA